MNSNFLERINDINIRVLPLHYKDVLIQKKDLTPTPSKIVGVKQYQTIYFEVCPFYKPISKFM